MRRITPALLVILGAMIVAPGTAWADWTMQAPPEPEGADGSYLYDFSCDREPPTTDLCTAAGMSVESTIETPLIARWEEGRWALQTAVAPRESTESRFFGVSCPTESICTAVGSYTTEAGELSLAERWNGTSWSVQRTVNPTEATTTRLNDVGCWTSGTCTAVGYAIVRSVRSAIAERWDGSTWTLQEIPLPEGATSSELDGVTCRNTTHCVAVGRYTERSGGVLALGAVWNGTSWSAPATAAPEGATSSYLLAVSCLEANTCIAVGGYIESGGDEQTLVENWTGRAWTLVPSPDPAGAEGSVLHGVSCTVGNLCAAVGSSVESGGDTVTLGLRWDGAEWGRGSEWQLEETPNPGGSISSKLSDVVCDDETCQAAGYAYAGSRYKPLGMRDDDDVSSWSEWPIESYVLNEHMNGIACTASNNCLTVGQALYIWPFEEPFDEVIFARVLKWNGSSWSISGNPEPSGTILESGLDDVSCTASNACSAVGSYVVSGGYSNAYAARWNGTSWTAAAVPRPARTRYSYLRDVSCTSSTACTAVGAYTTEAGVQQTMAQSWNGTTWSVQSTPAAGTASALTSVSCLSSSECIAVGESTTEGRRQPLAMHWNGSEWTTQTVPLPGEGERGALKAVSCTSSSACTAVGEQFEAGGYHFTYAVRWNGTRWEAQATPDPPFAQSARLQDVACASATVCIAVGDSVELAGLNRTVAAGWDGTSWEMHTTLSPGSTASLLLGVTCLSTTDCGAVGYEEGGSNRENLAATLP